MSGPDRKVSTRRLELSGDTSSLEPARRAVETVLRAGGVESDEVLDTAKLVVSELATNAIHAAPDSTFTVDVTVTREVVITVGNRGRAADVVSASESVDSPGNLLLRGRGLSIVRAVASSLSVADAVDSGREAPWVEVTATIELDDA